MYSTPLRLTFTFQVPVRQTGIYFYSTVNNCMGTEVNKYQHDDDKSVLPWLYSFEKCTRRTESLIWSELSTLGSMTSMTVVFLPAWRWWNTVFGFEALICRRMTLIDSWDAKYQINNRLSLRFTNSDDYVITESNSPHSRSLRHNYPAFASARVRNSTLFYTCVISQ